ncbi:hypothetical protein JCM13304A_15420 [Desulfothermus okinawensis JCM 13304]
MSLVKPGKLSVTNRSTLNRPLSLRSKRNSLQTVIFSFPSKSFDPITSFLPSILTPTAVNNTIFFTLLSSFTSKVFASIKTANQ